MNKKTNISIYLIAIIIEFMAVNAAFAAQLWPLQVGQKYAYRQSDPCNTTWTVQSIVNGQTTINSIDYFHLQEFNYYNEPVWKDIGYFRSTESQLYSYNPDGDEYLEFQKGDVGTKWILYRPNEEYNYEVKEIVSIEQVTVPYDTLDGAYKYRNYACVDPNNLSMGKSDDWYEWIVPGVGWVKEEDYWTDGPPAPVIMELMNVSRVGDITNDSAVNFDDYSIFAAALLSEPNLSNWNPLCDVSYPQNDIIDWNDLAFLIDDWLTD